VLNAWSRDTPGKKVYVQNKIQEEEDSIWEQLGRPGSRGFFFLCGSKQPEKDVYRTLLGIMQSKGGMTEAQAQAKMEELQAAGRYVENKPRAVMFVNKRPVEIIPQEENLLEVMEREGIRVPKFCYHPILSVAGNCRMCMVQVDGTQNIIVACATAALPGMSVLTDTRLVRDAREGNVELILINHPNDCPICEQATNCDLQHITMTYGTDVPRYREDKRAVNDFYFDPHTRVVLNRCIHCTRCVRFLNEHAQDNSLGMIGRGGLSEISTYMDELEVTTEHAMGAV